MNAAQEKRCLRYIMSDERGRAWMHAFLADSGLYRTTFVLGEQDLSAHLEGRRGAALRVFAQIDTHCPELYLHMLREARDRLKRDKDCAAKDEAETDE